ncbi:MAG: DUF1292 domain-containing protein [Bacillota bacterium]
MDEEMLIALTDEEGNEMNFVILDAVAIDDLGQYVLVTPADAEVPENDDDDEAEQSVVILKVIPGDDEEGDVFVSVDDEDEMDKVFAEFERRFEEQEDEE